MGKGLTEEQIASYHQNGFLFPLDVISREKAAECLQNLEAFEASQNQQMGKGFNFKPHLLFRWVDEIVHHPVILNAVEDLIGPNLRLFNLAVFPKNAHDAAYVTWHQDSTYFGLNPPTQITVWIALADAPIRAGCMEVVPGSHKLGQLHHSEHKSKDIMLSRGQTIDVEFDRTHTVFMAVKAGQCSIHDTFLVHASGPNQSDFRRVGMAISYIPTSSRCVSNTRLTAMLVRGRDEFRNFDDEPRPQMDYGQAEQTFHRDAVARFQQSCAEQAGKY
jgi:non-haem Fe2+, alpha-ketoglutarate-dependent halogenase